MTATCGAWVGPVWKLDGETCVCSLPFSHAGPHQCSCGATFEGCGHEPVVDTRPPREPEPTLIGPFGGEHPPLPPNAPRWRRIRRGIFRFFNEAGYNLIGGW